MPDGSLPFQDARPSLEIAGQREATLTGSLLTLDIVDTVDGLACCEALFGNWGGSQSAGFQHFDRKTLEFGKPITIRLGPDALFDGRISAISAYYPDGGPPQIGICAEDRLQDLRMARRTRCFADVTLADVAQTIAGEHGLTAQTDLSGPHYKVVAQANQSDLALLRDLARREDAQVWAEGTVLKLAMRSRRPGSTVDLAWAGTLREFNVTADLAHQRTALTASGWNVADKKAAVFEADEAAIQPELRDGTSGPATLHTAFGDRKDTLAHGVPFDAAQAQALAEASMRHLARRFVTGHGVAQTQAGFRVGAKLKLSGLGPLFSGEHTATSVHHRFDLHMGLRTAFSCDRPSIGAGA
jgi:phage protein D